MATTRGLRALMVVFVLMSVLTFVQTYVNGQDDARRADEAAQRAKDEAAEKRLLGRRVNESREQTKELIEQVERLGREPVVSQSELPPASVPSTDRITSEDIEVAVADYFQRFPIRVPQVSTSAIQSAVAEFLTANPPAPGRPPTDREVADQVVSYLTANPPRSGRDGQDGAVGPAGQAGVEGKDGRGVASAALDGCELVLTYTDGASRRLGPICGADGAKGDPGPAGPAGPPGEPGGPGRGVTAVSCDAATEAFVVTYTDGTTQAVEGSDCVAGGPSVP